jgi:hypothetical protein
MQPVADAPALPPKDTAMGKAIQAIMEAVALENPNLQGKLSVQIIWHYLQAPDSSFGWANTDQMPLNTKLLCVASCLKLGFTPGMGHVIWMGNKPYVTAEGLRLKANGDPNWVYTKPPKLRPLSNEEREMFCIEPGDMAGIVEATVMFKNQTLEIEGLGILEKNDNRPGGQGKKNRAMKLKTFAERDMLRRHYPIGISVKGEEDEGDDGIRVVHESAPALPPKAAEAKQEELRRARQLLDAALKRITDAGKTWHDAGQAIGCSVELAGGYDEPAKIMPVVEALLEYALKLETANKAAAEPAHAPAAVPETKADESVPVEAPKRGRPAKAAKVAPVSAISNMNTEEVMRAAREGALASERAEEAPEATAAAPEAESFANAGKGWSSSDPHKVAYRAECPKPYEVIDRLRATDDVKKDIGLEMELMGLHDCKLQIGDAVEIARATREWIGGDKTRMEGLAKLRPNL